MKHVHVTRICDALVLALIVGIVASFSWVAGLVLAAVGFWLGFVFKLRRPHMKQDEQELARLRSEDYEDFLDSGSLQNRHWHR